MSASSSRVLLPIPRGSWVRTVRSALITEASAAKPLLSIGDPIMRRRGPVPLAS
jgi:hypothetical protein